MNSFHARKHRAASARRAEPAAHDHGGLLRAAVAGIGGAVPLNDGVHNVFYNNGTPAEDYHYPEIINAFNKICDRYYRGGLSASFGFGVSF